jgi:hypothetical protein
VLAESEALRAEQQAEHDLEHGQRHRNPVRELRGEDRREHRDHAHQHEGADILLHLVPFPPVRVISGEYQHSS